MAGTNVIVKRSWPRYALRSTTMTAQNYERILFENNNLIITDLATLRSGMDEFRATATWDPASINDNAEVTVDVTVTGAALGDFVTVSFSLDVADLILVAYVTAANTVTAQLNNLTTGAINLSSGTLRVATQSPATVDAAGDLTAYTMTTPELGD